MKKPRKLITQNEIPAIGELSESAMKEDKTVLADWSISCCEEYILPIWHRYRPLDDRPKEALLAARKWLDGEIKLPEARIFILRCHEAARELAGNPGALAAARTIGQCASTIHSKRHALGLLHYGLPAMAFDSLGPEGEWNEVIKYADNKIMDLWAELNSKIEEHREREPVLVLEGYIRVCRSQLEKSRTGSSKHTLLSNRIDALMLARSLFLNETPSEKTDLKKSLAAVDSIIAKSEKAMIGQKDGGETRKRLERLIKVMRLSREKIAEYEKNLPE